MGADRAGAAPAGSSRRRDAAVAGAALATCIALALAGGRHWQPSGRPLGRARQVVLVGMTHVGIADLRSGAMPRVAALAGRGALGALNVRTVSPEPSAAEAYASLGAGARVAAGPAAAFTFDATEPVEGVTGRDALALRTGARPARGVVALDVAELVAAARRRHTSSLPGALGDALRTSGRSTAVVGNADPGPPGATLPPGAVSRPAALALMDGRGVVDAGTVSARLLAPSPGSPFGVSGAAGTLDALGAALTEADIVIVDPGDLDRAAAFAPGALPAGAGVTRRAALLATDRFVGAVAERVAPGTLLLVVGLDPPGSRWELTPIVAVGPDLTPGRLVSPTTERRGVATLDDLAPTVLDALGVGIPSGMAGHALRAEPGRASIAALGRLNRDAVYRERVFLPLTVAYIVVQALLYLAALAALAWSGRRPRSWPLGAGALRVGVLAVAAFPLASYLWRAIPGVARLGPAGVALPIAIALAAGALATLDRAGPLRPLVWVLAATVALILVDASTGAHLQPASLLGYSLHTSSRFFGLGNTALAVLVAASVLLGALVLHHARDRSRALLAVGSGFTLVLFVAAAPSLGSKVGALFTIVPVFGISLWRFSGRRLSWRAIALVAGALGVAAAIAVGIDLSLPADQRTHLGRLVGAVGTAGSTPLRLVVERKLTTTWRLVTANPWTEVIVLLAAVAVYLLVWERRAARLLPLDSALRTGVVAALAGGLLGVAANDSGSVIVALVFVFVGPLVTLLVCERIAGREPGVGAGVGAAS